MLFFNKQKRGIVNVKMIEARASSVISAAETGCVQSMGIHRYTL